MRCITRSMIGLQLHQQYCTLKYDWLLYTHKKQALLKYYTACLFNITNSTYCKSFLIQVLLLVIFFKFTTHSLWQQGSIVVEFVWHHSILFWHKPFFRQWNVFYDKCRMGRGLFWFDRFDTLFTKTCVIFYIFVLGDLDRWPLDLRFGSPVVHCPDSCLHRIWSFYNFPMSSKS